VENAVRYSPADEPIELAAYRDGGMLVFTVADRGPGVRAEDESLIFEPFYRGTTASPDTGRTGLGLSIARTLAEIQGGTVTYEPRAGGGSVFTVRLPATEVGGGCPRANCVTKWPSLWNLSRAIRTRPIVS
jgi:two-component system sensor histidine kinase KdpD